MSLTGAISCRNCPVREKTIENVLSLEELDRLDALRVFEQHPRGTTIFTEGNAVENHYSVFDGVVRLVKLLPDGRRSVVGFLFAGDLFGNSPDNVHSFSAEAVTDLQLCRFPRPKMEPLYDEVPQLKQRLLGIMAQKLLISHRRITDLARKSSDEKLATFLLALYGIESLVANDGALQLPMRREDIADYLGLSLETTSRTFSALEKQGIIGFKGRNNVLIKAPEQLEALAQGH